MKKSVVLAFMLLGALSVFGQGIRSGSIEFYAIGSGTPVVNIGIETVTEDIRFNITVDWGDGAVETIYGTVFPEPEPNLFSNIYVGQHIYQDTGIYKIIYTDSFWVEGITNIPNSAFQPFILKARVWLTSEINYSANHSILCPASTNYLVQDSNGVIKHIPGCSDIDGDEMIQKLIPVSAQGYFYPDATDSLACCFIWDKPVETGRYAFGMEFEDWREGKWRGTVQRFILVDVDSIPVTPSKEPLPSEKGLALSPNPAHSTIHISARLPAANAGAVSLAACNIFGQPIWQQTLPATGGEIQASVDVSTWPPGVYFISLEVVGGNKKLKWVEKVIVVH